MDKKNTILSGMGLKLLEDIVAKHGVTVEFSDIVELLKGHSRQEIRNFVSKLSRNGWLVRLKKGVYFVANLESLGFSGLSVYKTAQILGQESYVSFEAALQHYGMFDQGLKTIACVSLKRRQTRFVENVCYKFITCREKLFYGWHEKLVDNYNVKIAYPEKALIDMLCFHRTIYTVDVVLEKLKENAGDLNLGKFYEFIKNQSVTTQRIFGLLFDKIGIDSIKLHEMIRGRKDSSVMTRESTRFNTKWRLYYDKLFDQE